VVISDLYRYVFIEQPHTACTAIREELVASYRGRPILRKHATYLEFLAAATPQQRRYFTFSGIRNPLDEAVTNYCKYLGNHKGRYTDPARLGARAHRRAAYEFVAREGHSFADYLAEFHRLPFDNDTLIAHRDLDYVIRYERLQDDFAEVLRRLGIEQVRPLPVVNRTEGKAPYLSYYDEPAQARARSIFGPYMRKWGYDLPEPWPDRRVPARATLAFDALGMIRSVYRRRIRGHDNPIARARMMLADAARARHASAVLGAEPGEGGEEASESH
jgi:hypothetical protein